jgi:hypothetical protein
MRVHAFPLLLDDRAHGLVQREGSGRPHERGPRNPWALPLDEVAALLRAQFGLAQLEAEKGGFFQGRRV